MFIIYLNCRITFFCLLRVSYKFFSIKFWKKHKGRFAYIDVHLLFASKNLFIHLFFNGRYLFSVFHGRWVGMASKHEQHRMSFHSEISIQLLSICLGRFTNENKNPHAIHRVISKSRRNSGKETKTDQLLIEKFHSFVLNDSQSGSVLPIELH